MNQKKPKNETEIDWLKDLFKIFLHNTIKLNNDPVKFSFIQYNLV